LAPLLKASPKNTIKKSGGISIERKMCSCLPTFSGGQKDYSDFFWIIFNMVLN
jgi:hypothetical protein